MFGLIGMLKFVRAKKKTSFLLLVMLVAMLFSGQHAVATTTLTCNTTKYNQSGYPESWGKSWVPSQHQLEITDEKVVSIYGNTGKITKDTEKRLEFQHDIHEGPVSGYQVRVIYFRANGKLAIRIQAPSGYKSSGPIWGVCEENTFGQDFTHSNLSELTSDLDKIQSLISSAPKMSKNFAESLLESETIKRYSKAKSPKALATAFPVSCSYSYYSYNYSSLGDAMTNAVSKCQTKIDAYNRDFGKNCRCHITATNHHFLYQDLNYYDRNNSPEVPFYGEVISPTGFSNFIKGDAVFLDINKSQRHYRFLVVTQSDEKMCSGTQSPLSPKRGSLELECFNGKINGHGEYVISEYDPDLKVSNGTAKIDLDDGSQMLVIFGRAALEVD